MSKGVAKGANQVETGAPTSQTFMNTDRSSQFGSSVYKRYVKRIVDVGFVILILPIVAIPLAILFLIVRRDGGSFLYGQQRIGRDGELFKCFKIRSMVVDADKKLKTLLENDPELRREWEEHFKLKNDPRISKVGRLLRATSLDEIPQLLNVLKGDMSIVGPRPIVEDEVDKYGPLFREYKKARPGLTGPWQIKGRRDNDYRHRARMDADYVSNMSFFSDLYIIVATVPEVILAHGK